MSGLDAALFTSVLVFCRVGGCLMTAPGFSSTRAPIRVRLFIAVALSFLMTPLVRDAVAPAVAASAPSQAAAIMRETAVGAAFGLAARLYVVAFEMMASAMSTAIGLSAAFAPTIEGDQVAPVLANALTLAATALFFASGLDTLVIRALAGSYAAIPADSAFRAGATLRLTLDALQDASLVCLQIAAPILALSIAANIVIGLVSKFMPQTPIYFVATPLLIGAGLVLIFLGERPMFELFIDALARRISEP